MTQSTKTLRILGAGLLSGASLAALTTPAHADANVMFSSKSGLAGSKILDGETMTLTDGVTQIRLSGGGVASFVDGAQFSLRRDGSIDLKAGGVTVADMGGAPIVVHMPGGVEGRTVGTNSAASFSVVADGAHGHVMTGAAMIGTPGNMRRFGEGDLFAANRDGVKQVVANTPQSVPQDVKSDSGVVVMRDVGPAGFAANGIPIGLTQALAAAGASADIVQAAMRVEAAAANPSIDTFPVGDFTLLADYAAQASAPFGGPAFPGADADIVRTYFAYLAAGGANNVQGFLSVYSGLVVQYLDLLRSGALPSSFKGASQAQINAFIAFQGRTSGFGALSAQNNRLIKAYLAFLQGGGRGDAFNGQFTGLIAAYFDFLRAGGKPADFATASQATINDYLAFLSESGLNGQLSAANQALLAAYLASLKTGGVGFAFADQYRSALNAYFAFLAGGNTPSQYGALDQATLRQYLEILLNAGLLQTVLGNNAAFYADYLAFLRGGGSVDAFAGLPVNIYTGYGQALSAYFAYLQAGGVPSAYTALTQDQVAAYLAALSDAGVLTRFTGSNASFYAAYFAYLQGGGTVDGFTGLPVNIYTGYASALALYFEYLQNGGVPSGYTALTPAEITAYLRTLNEAGVLAQFLGNLGQFYAAYFEFVIGGGNPDLYAGLPTPPDFDAFASAVSAYAAYLNGGGLPADYTAVDLATLTAYVKALSDAGLLTSRLGSNATLIASYFAYLQNGGAANGFTGLPIYTSYTTALQAYYDYLLGGGKPSEYTLLTQAQILAYVAALQAINSFDDRFAAMVAAFLADYATFVGGGGTPDQYAELPGNQGGNGGTITPPSYTYAGGFPTNNAGSKAYGVNAGVSLGGNAPAEVDANGALVAAGTYLTPRTASSTEVAGDASIVLGRFQNGTVLFRGSVVNLTGGQSIPWLAAAPITGAIPTSGTVEYDILAATSPVFSSGNGGPGQFDAALSITFGSTIGYDLTGKIIMPETNGNTRYDIRADGTIGNPTGSFSMYGVMDGIGAACLQSNCTILFYGGFAGDTPQNRLGLVYQTVDNKNYQTAERIQGAVAFAAKGTTGGGGTPTPTPTPSTPQTYVGQQSGQTVIASNYANLDTAYNTSVTYDANGVVEAYNNRFGSPRTRGTALAPAAESGSVKDAIGWTRWIEGGTADPALAAQKGNHIVSVAPTTNMPTSGRVDYELIGATKPTAGEGGIDPGTFTGAIAVDFATRKVGFDFNVTLGQYGWNMKSNGGTTNLTNGRNITASNAFGDGVIITGTTAASCVTSCNGKVNGVFGGSGASHIGVAYGITDNVSSGNQLWVSGVAAFAAKAPSSGSNSYLAVEKIPLPVGNDPTPLPPPASPLAAGDWSRWTGPGLPMTASATPAESRPTTGQGATPNRPGEILRGLITFDK